MKKKEQAVEKERNYFEYYKHHTLSFLLLFFVLLLFFLIFPLLKVRLCCSIFKRVNVEKGTCTSWFLLGWLQKMWENAESTVNFVVLVAIVVCCISVDSNISTFWLYIYSFLSKATSFLFSFVFVMFFFFAFDINLEIFTEKLFRWFSIYIWHILLFSFLSSKLPPFPLIMIPSEKNTKRQTLYSFNYWELAHAWLVFLSVLKLLCRFIFMILFLLLLLWKQNKKKDIWTNIIPYFVRKWVFENKNSRISSPVLKFFCTTCLTHFPSTWYIASAFVCCVRFISNNFIVVSLFCSHLWYFLFFFFLSSFSNFCSGTIPFSCFFYYYNV